MATIKDVAERAQVAMSTVSYVLNGTKNVRDETRQRVLKAVKELDYSPNMIAKSLKTKKTMTIGVMVPDYNAFYSEVLKGIGHVADDHEYTVILCNTEEDKEKENRYLNSLLNKDIDGLIYIGTCQNPNIIDDIGDTPMVIIDRKMGKDLNAVFVDNVLGGYLAASHLLQKGATDVLLITGPLSISTYRDRLQGYIKAIQEKDMEYDETNVYQTEVSLKGGYKAIKDIFTSVDRKYGSIFASQDVIALGALKALLEMGIDIPGEVKIVGHDDIPSSEMYTPALTTVKQPKYTLGEEAAKLLFSQFDKKKQKASQIIQKPELIVRDTSFN